MSGLRNHNRQSEPVGKKAIRSASPTIRTLFITAHQQKREHAEIAQACGVSRQAMWSWKMGHSSPNLITIESFAEVLGYRLVLEKIKVDEES